MACDVWLFRVAPNPTFVFDIRGQSFTYTKESTDEFSTLPPFFPTRPGLNVAVEKRFRHEPLERDTGERVQRSNALDELPRLIPSCAVISTCLLVIVTLLCIKDTQPLHNITEIRIAAQKFPNLCGDLVVLIERTRIERLRQWFSHKNPPGYYPRGWLRSIDLEDSSPNVGLGNCGRGGRPLRISGNGRFLEVS
jgi:hypothetical protein